MFLIMILVSICTCFVAALVGYCFLVAKKYPVVATRTPAPDRQMTIGVIYGREQSSAGIHQSQVIVDSPPPYSTLDCAAHCSDQSKEIAIDFAPPPDYATIVNKAG